MFKILFTDIDGTLLDKSREITSATKFEIQRISQNLNIPVVLISSRMPKAIKHLYEELNLIGPVVAYNGALILRTPDTQNGLDIFYSKTIKSEIVGMINDYRKKCEFHMSLYYNDNWYVEGMDLWAKREVTSTKVNPAILSHEFVIQDWEEKNTGAHKIMCMGDQNEIQKLLNWLTLNFSSELNLYRSKATYLEITLSEVSKATALQFILNQYGIKSSEAVAIGDNYNDIEMLKIAGLGIAMGNAPDDVKAAADYITMSNNEDGLAYSLKKYF